MSMSLPTFEFKSRHSQVIWTFIVDEIFIFLSLKYKWASRCLKTRLIKSSKKTRKKNLEMTGL